MEFLDLTNASDGEVEEIETILNKVSIGVEFPLDFIGCGNEIKLSHKNTNKCIETENNDIDSNCSSNSISPTGNHQTFNSGRETINEIIASSTYDIKRQQAYQYYAPNTGYPQVSLSSKVNPIINQDNLKISYFSPTNQYPQVITSLSHVPPTVGVSSMSPSSVNPVNVLTTTPSSMSLPVNCACDEQGEPRVTNVPSNFTISAFPAPTYPPNAFTAMPAPHGAPLPLPPHMYPLYFPVQIPQFFSLPTHHLTPQTPSPRHPNIPRNIAFLHQNGNNLNNDNLVNNSIEKENLSDSLKVNAPLNTEDVSEIENTKEEESLPENDENASNSKMRYEMDSQVLEKCQIIDDNKLNESLDDNSSITSDINENEKNIQDQTKIEDETKQEHNEITTLCTRNEKTEVTPYVARSWADLFKSRNAMSQSYDTNSINNQNDINFPSSTSFPIDSIEDKDSKNFNLNEINDAQIKSISFHEDILSKKLARKLKEIHLKHSLPFLIPRGFVNRGNWCYINATLQALLYCPPFYNLMREIGEIPGINREKSSTPIIDSFAKFFANFLPSEQMMKKVKTGVIFSPEDFPNGEPFEPKCIYDVLGQIKSECLKGKQEDAEEFLSSILNGLHDEMVALFKYSENSEKKPNGDGDSLKANGYLNDKYDENNDDDSSLWREVTPKNKALQMRTTKVIDTPIMDIFGGSVLSVRTAGKDVCGNRQPFFTLQLDIQSEKIRSVEDALKVLTSSESIHGYTCPKTKQKVDASYQTFLSQLPPILILHLKLFGYDKDGGSKKLLKKIEYPIDLELPRECVQHERGSDKNKYSKSYKLLAVVHHDGNEAVKGHYITDIFHIGSGLWLRCDDNSVKAITTNQLLNPQIPRVPYLLFYRRFDTLRQTSTQRVTGSH